MNYDIREDEEQEVKLQEITELLVGAGYFRARIKGLAPFDKIVGGLTWCVLNCAVDLDVDLLYQENSSIGKKIALTEKIVAVLPKMKCPYSIEPHQIQGLDFINIFPVVQWLVKKALETRAEREVFNRAYSLREFEKLTNLKIQNKNLTTFLLQENEDNRPKRKLQPIKPFTDKEDAVRVMLTLLEYKDGPNVSVVGADTTDGENNTDEYENDMTEKKSKVKIDTNAISNILSKRNDELRNATKEYEEMVKNEEMKVEESVSSLSAKIENLQSKKDAIDKKLQDAYEEEQGLLKVMENLEADVKEKESKVMEVFEKINSSTPAEDQEKLGKMKKLITMNEKLKKSDTEFRQACKKELEELQDRNDKAGKALEEIVDKNNSNKNTELMQQLSSERKKLSEKTKLCLELERKIDRIPTRSELAQYQRRFVELYGQMDSTQCETQNFYDMFNNLGQQRAAIEKEISLMNSIQEAFVSVSSKKQHSKFELVSQLESLFKGVKDARANVDVKLAQQQEVKKEMLSKRQEQVIIQQQYLALINKIQETVRKNELLIKKRENMQN